MNIAAYIDHTLLKPATTAEEILHLCEEAKQEQFAAVCVPPLYARIAHEFLTGSPVKTATVIGFPFGYNAIEAKVAEVVLALVDDADELDMVINLAALKSGDWHYLEEEISHIMPLVLKKKKILKVIIESGILSDEEIIRCCELYARHQVHFLKTSTGYAEKGASVEAVKLMREHLPENIRIKASGGIRTFAFAKALIDAGADRLGCSAGLAIVVQSKNEP